MHSLLYVRHLWKFPHLQPITHSPDSSNISTSSGSPTSCRFHPSPLSPTPSPPHSTSPLSTSSTCPDLPLVSSVKTFRNVCHTFSSGCSPLLLIGDVGPQRFGFPCSRERLWQAPITAANPFLTLRENSPASLSSSVTPCRSHKTHKRMVHSHNCEMK